MNSVDVIPPGVGATFIMLDRMKDTPSVNISDLLDVCQWIPYTWQGEGAHIGKPVSMLRFSKCNLACPWCDSDGMMKAGPAGLDKPVTLGGLEFAVRRTGNLMLTGGEPFTVPMNRHRALWLIRHLQTIGVRFDVMFESNGVKSDMDAFLDLSRVCADMLPEHRVHFVWSPKFLTYMSEDLRTTGPTEFLGHLIALSDAWPSSFDFSIKPVMPGVFGEEELFGQWLDTYPWLKEKIYFMTLGATPEEIRESTPVVTALCKRYGVRFGSRVHIMHGFD